jgi:hypothetical protein
MLFAAFEAGRALKDGVEPVATVIDWPQRELVGYGARRYVYLEVHGAN